MLNFDALPSASTVALTSRADLLSASMMIWHPYLPYSSSGLNRSRNAARPVTNRIADLLIVDFPFP